MTHLEAVKAIVHFSEKRSEAFSVLLSASQSEVVYCVSNQDVLIVLDKVLSKQLDIDELEMWAQLLDMREDIDTQQVEGALYALSNPEQMGELSVKKLQTLRQVLSG
ncbi:hypothetical protein D9981_12570 [Pseudoalteromonas phenolica O-BC30]|uniref:Uncharacterized protein n=2 Tax=Pseudoalteromonas phenolica TaxID=161398 RepID=A0A0S2K4L6_9GAMM|nr:hypothetical protein PP2015_2948 [Pseudoalteromonas phenolica]RXE96226.1 hypothetical protein D9981_12570 [Pseudoalteromonas phenolica O-BC30]